MERNIRKKILAIFMIMVLISTDFLVLGKGLISYATELDNSTNNANILFSAYFKNDNGEKVDTLQADINADNLKLYLEVEVKTEGYFNGTVELQNSNFKLKDAGASDYVINVSNNIVTLNQINAGEIAEIGLDIEPIKSDKIDPDSLIAQSTLLLTGTYMNISKEGKSINSEKNVKLEYKVDESIFSNEDESGKQKSAVKLETEIITNDVIDIEGTNKRVIQLSVKSQLESNKYPIEQTTINATIPTINSQEPEEIKVQALSTKATNGKEASIINDFSTENNIIKIILKNEKDENGEISWLKDDVWDEIVITYIYGDEEVTEESVVEINTNSEIKIYNEENVVNSLIANASCNESINNIVLTTIEVNPTEVYKGGLYTDLLTTDKKGIEYETTTKIYVTNKELAEEVIIENLNDFSPYEFSTTNEYKTVKINKDKMLEILGEDAEISIGVVDVKINAGSSESTGTTPAEETLKFIETITKDTQADRRGDIVIDVNTAINTTNKMTNGVATTGYLVLNISKPVAEGTLDIVTTNSICTDISREDIQKLEELTIEQLTIGGNGKYINEEIATVKLKETTSKLNISLNKEALTTETENENVELGLELFNDGMQYDLYKNPIIEIKFPSDVEEVKITKKNIVNNIKEDNSSIFSAKCSEFNYENKTIIIKLEGEQQEYPASGAQIYIQLDMDITLNQYATKKQDKFIITYTNENASMYEGIEAEQGIIEKTIEISAPSKVYGKYSVNGSGLIGVQTKTEEGIIQKLDSKDAKKELSYNISVINNMGERITNVRILGNLPTTGNIITGKLMNSLETSLKSLSAEGATIYYTENSEATSDVTKTSNGWTSNLSELQNAKKYLIVVENMETWTEYNAQMIIKLPETIKNDLVSYSDYTIIYDAGTTKNLTVNSSIVQLETPKTMNLDVGLIATVGKDKISNGDAIKSGEVIKYTMTLKNTGTETLNNIILEGLVPEGTVVVEPEYDYQHTGISYYDELADISIVTETIKSLAPGEEYTKSYEVRVKQDINEGDTITNKAVAKVNNAEIKSNEITNKLTSSPIRVTVKRLSLDEPIYDIAGNTRQYMVFVENLSGIDLYGYKLTFINENFNNTMYYNSDVNIFGDEVTNTLDIEKIPAVSYEMTWNEDGTIAGDEEVTGNYFMRYYGKTTLGSTYMSTTVIVEDNNGNIYRSNIIIDGLVQADASISMTSPQRGKTLNPGRVVEYNIEVKNLSNIETEVEILDEIPQELQVTSLSEDGRIILQTSNGLDSETYTQKISNNIRHSVTLQAGESKTVTIQAMVKDFTTDEKETRVITNVARLSLYNIERASSEEIKHTLVKDIKTANINLIAGKAWLDSNRDGIKDASEKVLSGIKVKLYDVSKNDFVKDDKGNVIEETTNDNGEYIFGNLENGKYIVLFEYDTNNYEPTTRENNNVDSSKISSAIQKDITINGQKYTNYAVTDIITVSSKSVTDINLGLRNKYVFDLELNKYISRIVVQNSRGTKAYEYNDSTFQKVEINKKYINGTVVILEYTIKVKNTGNLAGKVEKIVDYLPKDLNFNSELNKDWYLSGDNLYTNSFANTQLNPGEEKEIKLVLTKTMTENTVGRINNRAEIYEVYNDFGISDIDSIPNNKLSEEDDMGFADVIIGISTGATIIANTILVIINVGLIIFAIKLMIKKGIIKVKPRKGGNKNED